MHIYMMCVVRLPIDPEKESFNKIQPPSRAGPSVVSLVPSGCWDVRLLIIILPCFECERLM